MAKKLSRKSHIIKVYVNSKYPLLQNGNYKFEPLLNTIWNPLLPIYFSLSNHLFCLITVLMHRLEINLHFTLLNLQGMWYPPVYSWCCSFPHFSGFNNLIPKYIFPRTTNIFNKSSIFCYRYYFQAFKRACFLFKTQKHTYDPVPGRSYHLPSSYASDLFLYFVTRKSLFK